MRTQKIIVAVVSIILSAVILSIGMILTVRSVDIDGLLSKINDALKTDEDDGGDNTYYFNITVDEGGLVNCKSGEYPQGERLELKASATDGYLFDGWYTQSGTCLSTSETYEVVLDKDIAITAKFTRTGDTTARYEQKEMFEILYEEYSEKNSEVQKETFKRLTSLRFDALDSENVACIKVLDIYIDKLYSEIKELRENDEEGIEFKETFADAEAPAYDSLMGMIGGIVNEKENYTPSEEEIKESVENIISSDICKTVIEESVNDEDVYITTRAASQRIGKDTYTLIKNVLQYYYDISSGEEKEACKRLAELLFITLDLKL